MKKIILLLLVGLFIISGSALAEPSITRVTGVYSNGETVEITGSSFGETSGSVIIGDNSIYGSCTHTEVQTIGTWTTTEIIITMVQDTFTNEERSYVYVVDSGTLVSNAYPIVWNESNIATQSLTITGTNFGDTGPTIYSWDDFESGINGVGVDGLDPVVGFQWNTFANIYNGCSESQAPRPIYSQTKHLGSSDMSLLVDWKRGVVSPCSQTMQAFGWQGHGPITELYLSFYRLQDNIPTYSSNMTTNIKLLYTNQDGVGSQVGSGDMVQFIPFVYNSPVYDNSAPPQVVPQRIRGGYLQDGLGSGYTSAANEAPWDTYGIWRKYYPSTVMPIYDALNDNTFHRFEFWVRTEDFESPTLNTGATMTWFDHKVLFDPVAVNNAFRPLDVSVGGKLNGHLSFIRDNPPNNTNLGIGGYLDAIYIGNMFQGSSAFTQARSYFDNVYMASSRARVEIGNSMVFDSCTKRDIQIVDIWSDTQLYLSDIQTPQFTAGEQAYVYVINEDGDVSDAIPYTIGSGAIGAAPILTNLTVNSRLFQVGEEAIFQWENVGGIPTSMIYTIGEGPVYSRSGESIAYQDSVHHQFLKPITAGTDKRYRFTISATNAGGTSTLDLSDYIQVISADDDRPVPYQD